MQKRISTILFYYFFSTVKLKKIKTFCEYLRKKVRKVYSEIKKKIHIEMKKVYSPH